MRFNCILEGDALEQLKQLPDNSVDCVMTSPPYWALRDYGIANQLGSEPDFHAYIFKLIRIFAEIKRILKPSGVCWVNLGDTRGGTKSGNTNKNMKLGVSQGKNKKPLQSIKHGLLGIPYRFVIAMQDNGWYLQEVPIWYKRNCMPQSRRGFTLDYEHIFAFTKNAEPRCYINGRTQPSMVYKKPSNEEGKHNIDWQYVQVSDKQFNKKQSKMWFKMPIFQMAWKRQTLWEAVPYYFEQQYRPLKPDSIQAAKRGIKFGGDKAAGYGPATYSGKEWTPKIIEEFRIATRPGLATGNGKSGKADDPNAGLHNSDLSTKREQIIRVIDGEPHGSYVRSVWDITTRGFKGTHFATFPERLVELPLKSTCPEQVCRKCGEPRYPILEPTEQYKKLLGKGYHDHSDDETQGQMQDKSLPTAVADYKVIGLTDCGCNAGFEPGVILDPFIGAGTVAAVAVKHGRRYIGIELNPEYIKMANERIAKCV